MPMQCRELRPHLTVVLPTICHLAPIKAEYKLTCYFSLHREFNCGFFVWWKLMSAFIVQLHLIHQLGFILEQIACFTSPFLVDWALYCSITHVIRIHVFFSSFWSKGHSSPSLIGHWSLFSGIRVRFMVVLHIRFRSVSYLTIHLVPDRFVVVECMLVMIGWVRHVAIPTCSLEITKCSWLRCSGMTPPCSCGSVLIVGRHGYITFLIGYDSWIVVLPSCVLIVFIFVFMNRALDASCTSFVANGQRWS